MRSHHLVLLALAAPIFAVGVVLWFLLPGSVSGLTYTPSQFDQDAILRPTYWTTQNVTLVGYVWTLPCLHKPCRTDLILGDNSDAASRQPGSANPTHDVLLLPQQESGWHAFLRRILPQVVSATLGTADSGHRVTITGRLMPGYAPGEVPVIKPSSL